MFCKHCGKEVSDVAVVCLGCGAAVRSAAAIATTNQKQLWVFIALGILLGGLGIHNVYAGYTGRGAKQLVASIIGVALLAVFFIGSLIIIGVGISILMDLLKVRKDASGAPFV
jgi:TM2 domain-containing membrane protein YozV